MPTKHLLVAVVAAALVLVAFGQVSSCSLCINNCCIPHNFCPRVDSTAFVLQADKDYKDDVEAEVSRIVMRCKQPTITH